MTKQKKQIKDEKKECRQKLEEKEKELKDLIDTLQRLQAEFENYKKRTEKENQEFRKFALQEFIKKLLPIIDNFELALENKDNKEEFVKGVELIYSELYTILEDAGLIKIEALNQKFDPYIHEALLAEKSDKEPNTIIEELQKGYKLHDKVLRHAKVKVSKK